ncbi:unnamed protein product [Psylliodes chrysocephalus]|uniref:Uncharacterized protein n=1 Tax=Psylliodes chrysocephalus TaxID=3402493 RepID=A0A9P0G8F5_9CUCU|nr:unnamed protein product [Psylliodes chrysocephala]
MTFVSFIDSTDYILNLSENIDYKQQIFFEISYLAAIIILTIIIAISGDIIENSGYKIIKLLHILQLNIEDEFLKQQLSEFSALVVELRPTLSVSGNWDNKNIVNVFAACYLTIVMIQLSAIVGFLLEMSLVLKNRVEIFCELIQTLCRNPYQTDIEKGYPFESGKQSAKVVMVEPKDPKMNNGIQKIYKDKYPELEQIEDDFEILEETIKLRSKRHVQKNSKIIRIVPNDKEDDLWAYLSKVKEEVEENETIAIHAISSMSQTGLQKMAAAIFHDSNNFVTVYVPYDKTNKKEQKERTSIGFVVSDKENIKIFLTSAKR